MDKYQVAYTAFCFGYALASAMNGRWAGVIGATLAFVLWVLIPLAVRGARSQRP
jgi:hypothetical protein